MNDSKSNRINGRGEKFSLYGSYLLFALYFINVLVGKVNIAYSQSLPHVGNVAEFLLLFGSCILLIIAALKRETAEKMQLTQTEKR